MVNEIFEIHTVRDEFLQMTAAEYSKYFTPRMLELAVYVLNDFCNNVQANELVLVRAPQQQPQQVQQQPQSRQVNQNINYNPMPSTDYNLPPLPPIPQMGTPQGYGNPFEEALDVRQNVEQMNAELLAREAASRRSPQFQQPVQRQEVDLKSANETKSFVDKVREMRAPKRVDKINPEE